MLFLLGLNIALNIALLFLSLVSVSTMTTGLQAKCMVSDTFGSIVLHGRMCT